MGGGGSDLSLNAVLFVPKWSGLSSPFLKLVPLLSTPCICGSYKGREPVYPSENSVLILFSFRAFTQT